MEFKKMLITPSIAKELLESNVCNRRVNRHIVSQYANDMSTGQWKIDTAECIKISKTKIILDGQHRLLAIIKSNIPVFFHIAFDVEDNVFDVLDTGKIRNSTDIFKIKGIQKENTIPSIIITYNQIVINKYYVLQGNEKNTSQQLLKQYYENPEFWQNVARISHNYYLSFAKIIIPSIIGGFYAYFVKSDKDLADSFFSQLCTGSNITNNTILLLRNKLIQDKVSVKKMQKLTKIIFIIKTWNAFVINKELKCLKFDADIEQVPIPINLSKNDAIIYNN
jgi:hypothetical protein